MTKRYLLIATLVFVVLAAAIAFMGYRAKSDIEAVVTDQFNRQQLLLAEKIAQDIHEHFDFLETCLGSLAMAYRAGMGEGVSPASAQLPFLGIFKSWNVLALGLYLHGQPDLALYDFDGRSLDPAGICDPDCLKWFEDPGNAGGIQIGRDFVAAAGAFAGRRIQLMRMGMAEAAGPIGGIVLVVDPVAVAYRYAHNVRSGETGYAWVVDDKGIFLDHYEQDFIGYESLEVRRRRNPDIKWGRLDWLLSERVLKGETGTDWYYSGWHRGLIGEVKKFVAYCPVSLSAREDPGNRWAVALAAPEFEVQGLIGRLMIRQAFIVGLFEAVVFIGFMLTLHFSLRWSQTLKAEVDKKAEALLRAQEKLIRSERFAAIGQAAAHLSHEIKNPLTLIGGFVSQVRRHMPPESADAGKLAIVEEEARRLESMLNEVRDFTRPVPPQFELADINKTVEDTLALLAEGLTARAVAVVCRLDKELPPVSHDPSRLRQVVLNLVKNAAEAMENGGTITVTTSRIAGRVRLTVADTGPGIPSEVVDKVFDPFCTTKATGSGLGLAVCHRIVTDHKGDIGFTTAAGKGTTFTIELPLG